MSIDSKLASSLSRLSLNNSRTSTTARQHYDLGNQCFKNALDASKPGSNNQDTPLNHFQEAAAHFESAVQLDYEALQIHALFRLGQIYYFGGFGVRPDDSRSMNYLSSVVQHKLYTKKNGCSNDLLCTQAHAQLIMAHLYFRSNHYMNALKYFQIVASQSFNNIAARSAQSALKQLSSIIQTEQNTT